MSCSITAQHLPRWVGLIGEDGMTEEMERRVSDVKRSAVATSVSSNVRRLTLGVRRNATRCRLTFHVGRPVLLCFLTSLLLLTIPNAWAATSTNYNLVKDTLSSGGQRGTSAATVLPVGVLGASLGGFSSNATHRLLGGYVQGPGVKPIIMSLTPDIPTKPYKDEVLTITATAKDPQQQSLEYQFWVDATVIRDWSPSNTADWTPTEAQLGRRTLKVIVRDPDGHQSSRISEVYVVRRPIHPESSAAPEPGADIDEPPLQSLTPVEP